MSCLAILRCSEGCSEERWSDSRSRAYQALWSVTDFALDGIAHTRESTPPELLSLGSSGSLSKLCCHFTGYIDCLGKHEAKFCHLLIVELGDILRKRLGKGDMFLICLSIGLGKGYTWRSVDKEWILRGVGGWVSTHLARWTPSPWIGSHHVLLYLDGLSADYSHCEGEWLVGHLWL